MRRGLRAEQPTPAATLSPASVPRKLAPLPLSSLSTGGSTSSAFYTMRAILPIVTVIAVLFACSDSNQSNSHLAQSAPLEVKLDNTSIQNLDGEMRSWFFDFTIINTGDAPLNLRYFVHAETPTGDISHRGVYPAAARRALTDRVKRMDFGPTIGTELLATGAELILGPGESNTEEGGILLHGDQQIGYSDVVLFVYDNSGSRVGQFPLLAQK